MLASGLQRMPSGNVYDGFPCVRVGDFLLPSSMDLRAFSNLMHSCCLQTHACCIPCRNTACSPLQGNIWTKCRRLGSCRHTLHSVWAPCCGLPAWQLRKLLQQLVSAVWLLLRHQHARSRRCISAVWCKGCITHAQALCTHQRSCQHSPS